MNVALNQGNDAPGFLCWSWDGGEGGVQCIALWYPYLPSFPQLHMHQPNSSWYPCTHLHEDFSLARTAHFATYKAS